MHRRWAIPPSGIKRATRNPHALIRVALLIILQAPPLAISSPTTSVPTLCKTTISSHACSKLSFTCPRDMRSYRRRLHGDDLCRHSR
ncbi:hypothetical protein B0T24DRAFT_367317 [Lasiosphaeria ovina]|uniref:Secreted protein n=1 Tax=Lasiosphaeria ovina TaxID=92902 RepID=A0AAE0N0V5_9PEZI|nr:hypothetical protein B0T24DRAFT_367317 [Lasiosphaeria ovina]